MRSNFETIAIERRDNGVLLVTLNRPEAANALNTQMGLDLMELFEGFSVDLEGVRVVIVTGAGAKAFCAGGDLKQRNGMTDEAWQAQHLVFERMLRAILACPIPVIAAVNGAAYGGGCEIAAAADFIYASGLRTDDPNGVVPNGGALPGYFVFNAGIAPGTCVKAGATTLSAFNAELSANHSVAAWNFAPAALTVTVGGTITAQNAGGEKHTFTEVENFGGGFVPALNTASGMTTVAPECAALAGNTSALIASGGTFTTDPEDAVGVEHYQCCIHPWMRANVTVVAR